jgi:hypothetical protein
MNSETSTKTADPGAGFRASHFYLLLAMCGATGAVLMSRDTHPAALLLLSGAVIASGGAAYALHRALMGFWTKAAARRPVTGQTREFLEREKALALRSIKELEFDYAMRKVSEVDFAEMSARLRQRALDLMQQIEQQPALLEVAPRRNAAGRPEPPTVAGEPAVAVCPACGTENDVDARFCKHCGGRMGVTQ